MPKLNVTKNWRTLGFTKYLPNSTCFVGTTSEPNTTQPQPASTCCVAFLLCKPVGSITREGGI